MTGDANATTTSKLWAYAELLVRPRRFYRTSVLPGDQASGLVFGMAVVAIEEATRLALAPTAVPVVGGQRVLSAVLAVGAAALVVTPVVLHLVAALQTAILVPFVEDRGAVSETVQVFGYATAPCVLAGLPVPALRVACTVWGAALLAVGISEIHGPRFEPAAFLSAVPAALVFGYGFRGFDALATLLFRWYII